MVREVQSLEEFNSLLKDTEGLIVVDFTASWCGPCKHVAPEFERLSQEHDNVLFLKVDVDKCRAVASQEKVQAMPTFKFFKQNGTLYHVFRGASVANLERSIQTYKKDDAEPNTESVQADGASVFCALL